MASLNKLHIAILTASTFLSTVIMPTAARRADNTSIRIWDEGAFGYSYLGCFTSDPSTPALDEGVNVTAPGSMIPSLCLHACDSSVKFLEVDRQARAAYMRHIKDQKECENSNKNDKDAFIQGYHHNNNNAHIGDYDYDNDKKYQYAGLAYDEEQGVSVCLCSDGLATISENVPDASCDSPCDGNSTWSCGGPDLVLLYNLTQSEGASATAANGVSISVLVGAFLVALGFL